MQTTSQSPANELHNSIAAHSRRLRRACRRPRGRRRTRADSASLSRLSQQSCIARDKARLVSVHRERRICGRLLWGDRRWQGLETAMAQMVPKNSTSVRYRSRHHGRHAAHTQHGRGQRRSRDRPQGYVPHEGRGACATHPASECVRAAQHARQRLAVVDGVISVIADPSRKLSFAEIVQADTFRADIKWNGTWATGTTWRRMRRARTPKPTSSSGSPSLARTCRRKSLPNRIFQETCGFRHAACAHDPSACCRRDPHFCGRDVDQRHPRRASCAYQEPARCSCAQGMECNQGGARSEGVMV